MININLKVLKVKFTISIILFLVLTSFLNAHGISQSDKQLMLDGGYLEYMLLGATHMISGYDHLLFLFGVLFFLNSFKDIVKFVTVFTIGHSITLIFATFYSITANYYLIDAVIALSVTYKGFDNLKGFEKYLELKSPNLMFMVFAFGLIHGFGLSTRLQQIPLGENKIDIFYRIISFNIGVELGQILALVGMLIVLKIIKNLKSFVIFSKLINFSLIVLGTLLFLMQLHGYMHHKYPNDFGFNIDEHYHIHEKMNNKDAHTHEDGESHVHEKVSQARAMGIAKNEVEKLSKNGTIHPSWEKIDPSRIEKNKIENYWLVSFKNSSMNKNTQTLYVFLDLYGEFITANYSGSK